MIKLTYKRMKKCGENIRFLAVGGVNTENIKEYLSAGVRELALPQQLQINLILRGAINIYGEQDLKIFESGVGYFK